MRNKIIIAVAVFIAVVLIITLARKEKGATGAPAGSSSSMPAAQLCERAATLEENNEPLASKELYENILRDYPDFQDIAAVQERLEALNMRIILSGLQTPQTVSHEIQKGDTLGKLAKQYNTTVELIKKSNNLTSDTIRLGQRLRIWKEPFSIYIDKSQNILMLRSGDEIVKTYRVATGKDNITPVGTFTITVKLIDPVWFKAGVAGIPPDSPDNILGTRWMGFDIDDYGIHGTTQPETIGSQATAGCIRMRNSDVEELYSIIPSGTKVTIVD